MWQNVLGHLSNPRDLAHASRVCRGWYSLIPRWRCCKLINPGNQQILYPTLSADGRILVVKYNNTIRIYDVNSGKCISTLSDRRAISGVIKLELSADGNTLALGNRNGQISIWNLPTLTLQYNLRAHNSLNHLQFLQNGTLVSAGYEEPIKFWDLTTGSCIRNIEHDYGAPCLTYSDDGNTLAITPPIVPPVTIIMTPTNTAFHLPVVHTAILRCMALSHNGSILATGSNDNTVRIWDLTTKTCRHTLTAHVGYINCLALSPDGNTLATGSDDQTVRVWDTNTGTCTVQFQVAANTVPVSLSLTKSPYQLILVIGKTAGPVEIWQYGRYTPPQPPPP